MFTRILEFSSSMAIFSIKISCSNKNCLSKKITCRLENFPLASRSIRSNKMMPMERGSF